MNIAAIIDENLLTPHGNRKGLSYGQLAVLLLTYIISEADHRLCCLEKWVNDHHQSLSAITGWKIGKKDATDDRLGTLDPCGMPLVGATLAGNGTDEADYVSTWRQMKEIIGNPDFLYLADSKASTWHNRAKINEEGGIYCFPLAMSQPRPKLLSDWVNNPVTEIIKFWQQEEKESEPKEIGLGFEVPLGSIWVEPETKKSHQWEERWLVVKSNALASRQIKGLHSRLLKGEKALATLAQRPGNEEQVLCRKVEEILKSNRISKYIEYSIEKKMSLAKILIY